MKRIHALQISHKMNQYNYPSWGVLFFLNLTDIHRQVLWVPHQKTGYMF